MFSAIHDRLLQLVTTLSIGTAGRRPDDRAQRPSGGAIPCNVFSGCMLFGYRRDV